MPDHMAGTYKEADFKHRTYYVSYKLSFEGIIASIDTDNILVIITPVSAKPVYNGKVKLFNKI